jgi:hypothetical protein
VRMLACVMCEKGPRNLVLITLADVPGVNCWCGFVCLKCYPMFQHDLEEHRRAMVEGAPCQ